MQTAILKKGGNHMQAASAEKLLVVEKVSKAFPGVKALTDVDFTLEYGEVHALMGENGAGKSTLMNILSGVIQSDSGHIYLEGKEVSVTDPRVAQNMGISTIHQELNLVQKLSVAENVFFGRQPKRHGLVDKKMMEQKTAEICRTLGVDLDPAAYVKDMSMANQQMVEIVRAVSFDAKLVIMDEPTSSLTINETQILFSIIRNLTKQGVAVVFISHRMDEIFEIADRLTVLRDGKLVGTMRIGETTRDEVIRMMVGRELKQQYPPRQQKIGEVCLRVTNMADGSHVRGCSFELHRSEVLGFAGLVGAGRTELMKLIFGAEKRTSGQVEICGKNVNIRSPRDAIRSGLGFVTEDRKGEGLILSFPVKYNIVMVALKKIKDWIFLNRVKEQHAGEEYIQKMRISTPTADKQVMYLSGGNQQKVVLSKWLFSESDIIIMDEPTRGIDVGAKRDIYELINELVAQGRSIIVISSEMEEIMGISDRILVMREGHITGELSRGEFSPDTIMQYAVGGK